MLEAAYSVRAELDLGVKPPLRDDVSPSVETRENSPWITSVAPLQLAVSLHFVLASSEHSHTHFSFCFEVLLPVVLPGVCSWFVLRAVFDMSRPFNRV